MESITPRPRRQRATTALQPGTFLAERLEMQRLAFGALAHELGNVTSPVALISQVLERDLTMAHLRSASSALARVSETLQVLTALTRGLRGSQDYGIVRMPTVAPPLWWQAFSPFVEEVIPATCRISADVLATLASPQRLDAITTTVPPLARAMTRMSPGSSSLAISLTGPEAELEGTLTRVVMRLDAQSTRVQDPGARRWMGLALAEARCAGGTITTRRVHGSLQCVLSFDGSLTKPDSAPAQVGRLQEQETSGHVG